MDVDLNGHTRQSLALIGNMLEVKGAPEIEEWKKLSMVWQNQPPEGRIHLFVKLLATGERKPLLQMEHHLESFFTLFCCSLMPQPLVPLSILQRDSPLTSFLSMREILAPKLQPKFGHWREFWTCNITYSGRFRRRCLLDTVFILLWIFCQCRTCQLWMT